jgi:hypothetical protein
MSNITDRQFAEGLRELKKPSKRFCVDDALLWTSPHTGEVSEVSFRGMYAGQAMIWTGRMQFSVPVEQLKKKEGK